MSLVLLLLLLLLLLVVVVVVLLLLLLLVVVVLLLLLVVVVVVVVVLEADCAAQGERFTLQRHMGSTPGSNCLARLIFCRCVMCAAGSQFPSCYGSMCLVG
jgi:hypothetical protein